MMKDVVKEFEDKGEAFGLRVRNSAAVQRGLGLMFLKLRVPHPCSFSAPHLSSASPVALPPREALAELILEHFIPESLNRAR